jgi:hypothetical protein
MQFYGQENQYFNFLNKLYKLCIAVLNNDPFPERDFPRLNLSNIFKDRFYEICLKINVEYEMPKNILK